MKYIVLESANRKKIYARLKNIRDFCLMNFYVLQYLIANDADITSARPNKMPYISYNEDNHRICIFKSANQYLSFSFPYNYKNGKWYSSLNGKSFGSREISPRVCSHILTLIENWAWPFELKNVIEFDAFMDPDDARMDWEYAVAVVQSRLLIEGGYVRHDDDKGASLNKELKHPRRHYDINYNEYSKIKIGKASMDSHIEFERFFIKGENKSFLYHPNNSNPEIISSRNRNQLVSPFRRRRR